MMNSIKYFSMAKQQHEQQRRRKKKGESKGCMLTVAG